ncbi:hypothetical protein C8R44DRAFT_790059 [Mycena epipterygia]|nr:hypothetical protein C8R44DRAFT_790059 [Mycena epipterygia]
MSGETRSSNEVDLSRPTVMQKDEKCSNGCTSSIISWAPLPYGSCEGPNTPVPTAPSPSHVF